MSHAAAIRLIGRWGCTASLLLVLGALGLLTRGFTAFPSTYYMTGESMGPTLGAGDWFLARPLQGLPERGELVVMQFHDGDTLFHVLRRAVGLPGDTVAMRRGGLFVNGRAPGWPARVLRPAAERPLDGPIPGTIYNWGPVVVGGDSVFVLSDTRDLIGWPDSRLLGAVPAARLEDRMMFMLWRRSKRSVPFPARRRRTAPPDRPEVARCAAPSPSQPPSSPLCSPPMPPPRRRPPSAPPLPA